MFGGQSRGFYKALLHVKMQFCCIIFIAYSDSDHFLPFDLSVHLFIEIVY
jgi:hypothetical protein